MERSLTCVRPKGGNRHLGAGDPYVVAYKPEVLADKRGQSPNTEPMFVHSGFWCVQFRSDMFAWNTTTSVGLMIAAQNTAGTQDTAGREPR